MCFSTVRPTICSLFRNILHLVDNQYRHYGKIQLSHTCTLEGVMLHCFCMFVVGVPGSGEVLLFVLCVVCAHRNTDDVVSWDARISNIQ